jgi:DNA polymerase bacteriophage-type
MRPRFWLDLETYSETPINYGTHRYAATAEILIAAYALDDGAVQVIDCTEPEGLEAWRNAFSATELIDSELVAQNAAFDRTILNYCGLPSGIPRWRCTMAQALSHSLPASLGELCEVLRVPTDQAKDKRGRELINLFCKPRPKNSKIRRATKHTHPKEWAEFISYAALDVEAMRACAKRMPTWNYQGRELDLWHRDQAINDRGVGIDLELAKSAITAVAETQRVLAARTVVLTEGQVKAATQRNALLLHLLNYWGVSMPDLQQATVERRIDDPEIPAPLKELLNIRLLATTSSTSKYKKMVQATSDDGRLRNILQFNGAARTGRWAGRMVQPQNFPRPVLLNPEIFLGIDALKHDCAELITDNIMQLASSALRSAIVAPAGKKIVAADLSNIEGRGQAWLTGETWKLKAFAEYDAGTGPDLYKLAYARSFGIQPGEVDKNQRQIGKVQELALGFGGGVGAFLTFAAGYGMDLDKLADEASQSIPGNIYGQAQIMLDWTKSKKRSTFGLTDKVWLACESFKLSWRAAHPETSTYWGELEHAAREAIYSPQRTIQCRRLKLRRDGAWLRIQLPSGRSLCYPHPQVSDKGEISYMGKNQYTRQWQRLKTYGGKLFENVCQALARDVMAHNMPSIEDHGYNIVLTVHDEAVTEAPDADRFNPAHLSSLLAATPPWGQGMPLSASGFEDYRYKKDD